MTLRRRADSAMGNTGWMAAKRGGKRKKKRGALAKRRGRRVEGGRDGLRGEPDGVFNREGREEARRAGWMNG